MNEKSEMRLVRDMHHDPELFDSWLERHDDATAVVAATELAVMLREAIEGMGEPENATQRNNRAGLLTAAAWLENVAVMKERGPHHEGAEIIFVDSFEGEK